MELPGVVVHSLYKPPPEPFLLPPLGQRIKPHIVIGDFNSNSTLWGYTTTDSDGEAVEQWADSNRLSLVHNAKLSNHSTVQYGRRDTTRTSSLYLQTFSDMCEKSVLDPIPRTQHRPICVTVHPVIVPQPTLFRRRFNLRKAKWDNFSTDFDEAIEEVEPIPENYDRFIGLIHVLSRRHIPRGCRTNYIPGLTEESQSLYEAYKKQYTSNPFAEGTLETENKLIDTMKEEEVITSIDLTHNSRKAWQTIKRLSNDPTSPNPTCLVNSNQVAHHLLVNGQGTMPTKPKCPALLTVEGKPSLVSAFSEEEYRKGIAALKNNKAAGINDILVEQLKNLGPKAHKWLHTMLNTCFIDPQDMEVIKDYRHTEVREGLCDSKEL